MTQSGPSRVVSAAPPNVTLSCQRALFDVPEDVTYLNCANLAPRLHSVSEAGARALRVTAAPWTISPNDWFASAERLRALFAQVVNADPEGVALVPSVSYGIAVAAANVPIASGQSIVVLDREFPSNVYAWRALGRRHDAVVRTVQREDGATWTDALLNAIDDDTAVVAVPNCHWTNGALIDLARVGRAARSCGAALVVDASQSIGAYPFDVAAVQPDFLVTVGYKWLLGPYGLGYLYAAPRWRERGTPIEYSWLTRAGSDDFTRLVNYTDSYRPGARRFDMGEFSQFVLTPMAVAALEQVLHWGVDRIQATLAMLTAAAVDGVIALGRTAPPNEDRVGHMTGIRLDGGALPELQRAFTEEHVYVSLRGGAIRVAPHLHNDQRDIDRFLRVLQPRHAALT